METNKPNRLDRIDRYEGVNGNYKSFTVSIKTQTAFSDNYQKQVMAVISLSLLCRWCSAVTIGFDDCRCVIEKYKGLRLSDVFKQIAHGHPCKVLFNEDDAKTNATLFIGAPGSQESFWMDCNDWLAGYGYGYYNSSKIPKQINPLGAAFAACLGVAEMFRIANRQKVQPFSKWYSLVDFQHDDRPDNLKNDIPFPSKFEAGKILQVGCGAVGSNFLFLLGLTDWIAKIDLVDYDSVADENCANSLLFNEDHIDHKKVIVCSDLLRSALLTIEPFDTDYNGYKKEKNIIAQPDLLLCFANERNIWEDIQYNLPPLSFHATTNKNWGINFGRHIPCKEWCLVCRFEKDLHRHKEIEFGCSKGLIKNEKNGEETIGMLPFLSAASALFVLIEMAKLPLQEYPINYNFTEFSFATRNGLFMNLPNKRKPCFICKAQSLSLYEKFRGNTRYWHLSK